ncbi:MAG: glycosyltransferase [Lentisphaeria bacterium]|nr:glycosyltransferase [Lentisphaeria bacterium]NQZ70900.1 glycosyltransferase [Lentisphaeria bacterium]
MKSRSSNRNIFYILGEEYLPERAPVSRAMTMTRYLRDDDFDARLLLLEGPSSPEDDYIHCIKRRFSNFKMQLLYSRLAMLLHVLPDVFRLRSKLTLILRDPFISVLLIPFVFIFRVNAMHDFHGFVYPGLEKVSRFGYWVHYFFERLTIQYYKKAIAINQAHVDQLPASPDVHIVTNGVDLDRFEGDLDNPYLEYNIPDDHCIAVFIGFMCFFLDLPTVIEAAKLSNKTTYVVVGNGSEYEMALLRDDLPDNLILAGLQPREKVANFIVHADIGIIAYTLKNSPNLDTDRTSARKLTEYMAGGLPMVICDLVPETDFLKVDKSCVFFETDSPESLYQTVESLFSDKEKMLAMQEKNCQTAQDFSWEKVFKESKLKEICS